MQQCCKISHYWINFQKVVTENESDNNGYQIKGHNNKTASFTPTIYNSPEKLTTKNKK